MFLKKVTIKNGDKTYNYYKIVASYRDNEGKTKHRLIQNLGALSDEEAAQMRLILQAQQGSGLVVAQSTDITVTRHWLFLPIVALHSLWELFQLHRFFSNPLLVEAMVLNRCLEPLSKIHIVEWAQGTVLPAFYPDSALPDDYAVYRELDALNQCEADLQAHLYRQLERIDPSTGEGFFYDITSTYMEGSQCVIAKLGYSRDHRPDLEQIVIALMVTPQGSPFYWKVLEGNTPDITTIPGVVQELKARFNLSTCHLVFDRGMVSADHLALLEAHGMTYLSAMDKSEMACHPLFHSYMPAPASRQDYEQLLPLHGFQPADGNAFFYTREGSINGRRHIFVFDVSRFFEDIASREKRIAQAMAWVAEKNASLAAAKKARNPEVLEREAKQMLGRRKLKSLLQVTLEPIEVQVAKKDGTTRTVRSFRLWAKVDPAQEAEVRKCDGMTCFITNEAALSPGEVMHKYREKNKIEEAFREMKSQLALRPIHLTRPERVKAHVSLCIMAYLLRNTMEMMLQNAGESLSAAEALGQLRSCQLNEVGFKHAQERSITMTEMTAQQKQRMKQLGCESYLKSKSLKQLTESLQKRL